MALLRRSLILVLGLLLFAVALPRQEAAGVPSHAAYVTPSNPADCAPEFEQ